MDLLNKALEFLNNGAVAAWVVCLYVVFEAFVGLSKKLPFNSTLEGIVKAVFELLKFIKGKLPKKEPVEEKKE